MNVKTETVEEVITETIETTAPIDGKKIVVSYPVLLLFAEYLGYETPLIEWAEAWCKDKAFPAWKKSILSTDAIEMYKNMVAHETPEFLRSEWNKLYDLVMKNWSELLKANDPTSAIDKIIVVNP